MEKEAAEVQVCGAGSKAPTKACGEGLSRALIMLDTSIKILELEPPASTELRWVQAARKVRQQVFDLIATMGGAEVGQ